MLFLDAVICEPSSMRFTMFGMLWLILHTLALLAEGGVSSGSGEVAAGNGGGNNNNNNGVGGGGAAAGIPQNGAGLPQNGLQPLINPAYQLVPVGGSFFIQPFGNALAPQGPQGPQGPVRQQQQLVPFGPFQQGAGGFFLGPQAVNLIPQSQGGVVQAGAAGVGGAPLYTVLSQHGGPRGPMFLQGQQLQLVPLNPQNPILQSQLQQGPVLRGAVGNVAAGRARARRSVAANRGRMLALARMGATASPTGPAEEESSGMDTEEQMTV
ncbi:unnamed protein product [Boreogadus saida]